MRYEKSPLLLGHSSIRPVEPQAFPAVVGLRVRNVLRPY